MRSALLIICLLTITVCGLFSQQIRKSGSDQQKGPFIENELSKKITKQISIRYMIHLPEGYASTEARLPLLLYLHGGMGRGNDFQKLYWYPVPEMILENKFPNSFIVVIPQCPAGKMWTELIDELIELINEITHRYRIDKRRIYGIGYSMGGNGIVYLAYTNPEIFAAIAPMSGYYHTWWVSRIKDLPIWFFHGAKDTLASVDESDKMVEEYKKFGVEVKYSRDAVGIHRPPTIDQHLELLNWFLKQSR